ncbi:MAG: hypothetical protein JSW28_00315, partial [Thermoplasmata archaeon]
MGQKAETVLFGLILLLVITPGSAFGSQEDYPVYYEHYWPQSPRFFFMDNATTGEPELTLMAYVDHDRYIQGLGSFVLGPNESITLTIHGVLGLIPNPDIPFLLNLDTGIDPGQKPILSAQLRFDSDGNGDFEYIVDFQSPLELAWGSPPSSTEGEPQNLTGGAIEFQLWRTDNSSMALQIFYGSSSIMTPFDMDLDNDGIGDFSDEDDDNDGRVDENDAYPFDPNEWMDTDGDGIGDNADTDDNGNGLEDDYEVPVAMGIILIPFVMVALMMKRIR